MTARRPENLDAAVQRAVALAGPGASLRETRLLRGGSHALTCLIETADPERQMVMREFPAGDPGAIDEERVLTALGGLDGLAPEVLATELASDQPWVLITRLPGVADILPGDPRAWAAELGATLARLQRANATSLPSVFERRGRDRLSGPAAPAVDAAWDDVILGAPAVLVHGDFHGGNVLWEGGRVSGVVDWEGGARGPAGHDVGWCRLDLVLLHDEAVADHFLDSYRRGSGAGFDPHLWDLWAVARSHAGVESWVQNYRDLGRPDLTPRELRRRHADWTRVLLERGL